MPIVLTRSEVPDAKSAPRRNRQNGFSLLELLIVLAIMALLGTLVGPKLFQAFNGSQVKSCEIQARMLKTALDTMRLGIGRYPTAEEGLQLLVIPPTDPQIKP